MTMTTLERNKSIIRRWIIESYNQVQNDMPHVEHAMKVAAQTYHPDVVDHNPFPGQAPGYLGSLQMVRSLWIAIPDMKCTSLGIFGEDDMVASFWHLEGTHLGPWLNLPPTGGHVDMTGQDIFRMQDGKIVETWHHEDIVTMMIQFGAPWLPHVQGSIAPPEPELVERYAQIPIHEEELAKYRYPLM